MKNLSRRTFLGSLAATALTTAAAAAAKRHHAVAAKPHVTPPDPILFIGTGTSKGILAYRFLTATGELLPLGVAAETPAPGFLALSSSGTRLFAVNSTRTPNDTLTAFRREGAKLTPMNSVSAKGTNPCHIAVDRTGGCVFVADYDSGTAASYKILPDGSLSEAVTELQLKGSGPNASRQSQAHAHRVTVSPDNHFVYINDLGSDRIWIYKLNASTAELTPAEPAFWAAAPGSGPRSLRFHPNNRQAYCVNELTSTVNLLDWDRSNGALATVDTTELLPAGYSGPTRGCESALTLGFAYFANRDNDFLATYHSDMGSGRLSLMARSSCGGKTPRHISLDPSGRWLLVANQDSNNVVVFGRDTRGGRLSETGRSFSVDTPMCLLFG